MKIDLKQATFIIPIRIESEDRLRNVITSIAFLLNNFDTNIIVKEVDKTSVFAEQALPQLESFFGVPKVKHIFEESDESLFHRQRVLNEMIMEADTDIVVNYDCDVILPIDSYVLAYNGIMDGVYDVVYPYGNGMYQRQVNAEDSVVSNFLDGNDYSAFVVVDITTFPHKVVAKYRDNTIKPMLFPSVIYEVARSYNQAFILCEVNDVGDQVASILQYDLEYQNLLMCSMRGRAGQIVGQGFSGQKTQLGVKMSKTVKKVGSLNLKAMIEEDKLIFCDYDIISELTTFISKSNSFEAEEGCNDDLAMCLVIYAWLVAQDYFKELTDQDIRKRLYEEQKNQIEQDMAPFGFIDDGLDASSFVDSDGDRWSVAKNDEYGTTAGGMDYMWNSW